MFNDDSKFRLKFVKMQQSPVFIHVLRFFIVLNVVAYGLLDYGDRIGNLNVSRNNVGVALELLCDIFFFCECFINIVS